MGKDSINCKTSLTLCSTTSHDERNCATTSHDVAQKKAAEKISGFNIFFGRKGKTM